MKIKTRLRLSMGLLFLLIALLAIIGISQLNSLSTDTNNILTANYNTLDYSENMLRSIDNMSSEQHAISNFEKNLELQQNNITEPGEDELTESLANIFEEFKKTGDNNVLEIKMRGIIYEIMRLNMNAIERKSELAKNTAKQATTWMTITGSVCFLIAFSLFVNLPGSIANPIREFTDSIKEIASMNYSERIHYTSRSEFGDLARSFNTMAEKLQEYNNSNLSKLMMEKERIETLINNMQDPVIGLDERNKILFINKEALKVTGLVGKEIIGRSAVEIAVNNDLIRSLIQEMYDERSEHKSSAPLKIYADGKESYFEKHILDINIIPTGEESSKTIGQVIILRNVTSYKELDFAKTNFIATVSHELKTPISSIKMSVQLLENEQVGKLNEEQKNLIDSISEDSNRLLGITSELLNITQVESGKIQLGIIPAEPREMITYAVNANKAQAEQKNIKLHVSCPDNIPKVLADSEKTAWVFTNLISNAIRYSYENSTIYIEVSRKNSRVNFSIRDTGQGIAPQYKEKIFDRYFRIPGSKKEGTGLGLSISKEFIEAEGGEISVDSEFGVGSEFIVMLNAV